MGEVIIDCRKCDKLISKEIQEIQDVFDIVCPECGSEDVWIRNVELDNDNNTTIVLGNGGCTQK